MPHQRGDTVPTLVPTMRDGDGVDLVGAAGDIGVGDGAAGVGDGVGDTGEGDAGSMPAAGNHVSSGHIRQRGVKDSLLRPWRVPTEDVALKKRHDTHCYC